MAENGLIGGVLGIFDGLVFLEESSEKGSTRKHTKKRVTRWKTL
jgi:Leu/Phe-tRNA-protein transferase